MRRRPSAYYGAIAGAAVFAVSATHIPVGFLFLWNNQYSVVATIYAGLILCGLAGFGAAAIVGLSIEIYRGLKSLFRLNGV